MSSQLSWSIIKQFSGRNTFGFTFQDVAREFWVTKKQARQATGSFGGFKYQLLLHDTTRILVFAVPEKQPGKRW